jgi:hypothetical protein
VGLEGVEVGDLGACEVWSDECLMVLVMLRKFEGGLTLECSHCAPSVVKIPFPRRGPMESWRIPIPKSLKFVARMALMFSGSIVLKKVLFINTPDHVVP